MMTSASLRPARRRRAAPRRLSGLLIVAVVVGLIWMHALSGGHHPSATAVQAHGAPNATSTADDPCAGHGGSAPCPPDQPEHPGPVCQAGAVAGGAVLTAPGVAGTLAYPAPPDPVRASVATVAGDAGTGTGCGPPSLTMLSISRK